MYGGDDGMGEGEGYYWYEKISGPELFVPSGSEPEFL
jgi:hypothetical protein